MAALEYTTRLRTLTCSVAVKRRLPHSSGFLMPHRGYSTPSTDPKLYTSLGLTPAATQQQIKDAYRELSIKYHPDKNKGSAESHDKFAAINEAYQVLGNYDARKRYDRYMGFGKETRSPGADPANVGRSANLNYNFDEWHKRHYAEKQWKKYMRKEQEAREGSKHHRNVTRFYGFFIGIVLLVYFKYLHERHIGRYQYESDNDEKARLERKLSAAVT